ncbi:fasciclin domain-containing protein [Solicola sp. PLA-1-18]|uniref:fasciclin domain-containing protein n=1 Tax=Solicola sp. PLA-1-18 TaxID=3380532 RepID=UPI003B768E80
MRSIRSKSLAVAAVAPLLVFTAACGGGSDESSDSATSDATTDASPSADASAADSDLVGPGCADYAAQVPDGAGSVEGMSADPVATAASNNPLLKTLTAAVSGKLNPDVNLVDTLNGGEFTVFAPVDSAFAKLPAATVETLGTPEGAETLTQVLTYHVIEGQKAPDEIDGTFPTVNGADLTISGSGDTITVGDQSAKVICGGVKTANATVYLIDSVLMPPAAS